MGRFHQRTREQDGTAFTHAGDYGLTLKDNDADLLDKILSETSKRIAGKLAVKKRFPAVLEAWLAHSARHEGLSANGKHGLGPDTNMKIVRIAGTNGKGSVCAMLEACLRDTVRIGVFTSPHLISIEERFRINGEQVGKSEFHQALYRFWLFFKSWLEFRGPQWMPSFFEVLILVALDLFQEKGVEVAIFEAGVGGYNDAVGYLNGRISAITSVGLDHQDRLGHDLSGIAADKAGIAADGGMLALGPALPDQARSTIIENAARRGVTLVEAAAVDVVDRNEFGTWFKIPDRESRSDSSFKKHYLSLAGDHQVENLCTCLSIMRLLRREYGLKASLERFGKVAWPGRLQWLTVNKNTWLCDVAHNQPAISKLQIYLDRHIPYALRTLVLGVSNDKDFKTITAQITALAPNLVLVGGFYRAASPEILAASLPKGRQYTRLPTVSAAIDMIHTQEPLKDNAVTIVTGSVFLVGDFLKAISSRDPPASAVRKN